MWSTSPSCEVIGRVLLLALSIENVCLILCVCMCVCVCVRVCVSLSLCVSRGYLFTFDFLASFVCNSFLDCLVTPWIQTVINFLGFRCVQMIAQTVVHHKRFLVFWFSDAGLWPLGQGFATRACKLRMLLSGRMRRMATSLRMA